MIVPRKTSHPVPGTGREERERKWVEIEELS